jgi:hypothetical protein
MANILTSKRLQVDKATRTMVVSVAVAAFIALFCILSAKSLSTVLSYQNRVIDQQNIAVNTLSKDVTASKLLDASYTKFNNATGNNLLGASSSGTGPNQGDNAKLILDALPSINDYPALVVSVQNLFASQGVAISSIAVTNTNSTGTAAPATSSSNANIGSAIAIPITFSITGPLANIQNFINHVSQSILPIQFLTLSFSGSQSALTMSVTAQTYYQAPAMFNVTTEIVK